MKKSIAFLCLFTISIFCQDEGWHIIYSGSNYHGFYKCYFLNADTGFVLSSDGKIFRTKDGGKNWDIFQLSQSGFLSSIFFIGNKGWACGGSDSKGLLTTTEDFGETWKEQYNFANINLMDVFFLNENIGFILEQYRKLLKTTDGGETWIEIEVTTDPHNYLSNIFFVNDSSGWIGGYFKFLNSDNQGNTWNLINNWWIGRIYFINPERGWMIVEGNFFDTWILSTTDAGITWRAQLVTREGENVWGFSFINELQGWAVGDFGKIWSTSDGGDNWFRQDSVTDKSLWDVQFVNANIGYAVGSSSTILKTYNGGATSINEENPLTQPSEFSLSQNYPNPFNPVTTIKYTIPNVTLSGVEGFRVVLKVYDILGNEIVTLVNEEKPAGSYEVEFKSTVGSLQLASGIYFYRLQAGNFVSTKKMVLIK